MIDFNRARRQTPRSNLALAFEVAEQIYGVTPLLDPEGSYFHQSSVILRSCKDVVLGGRCYYVITWNHSMAWKLP